MRVLIIGSFDLFHSGHVAVLKAMKEMPVEKGSSEPGNNEVYVAGAFVLGYFSFSIHRSQSIPLPHFFLIDF